MQTLYIHPQNPQPRLITQVAECFNNNQISVLPSQFGYVFATALSAKQAQEALQKFTKIHWVLMCQDLTQLSHYATISNEAFQALKNPATKTIIFNLPATKATPKNLTHPKHKTIGSHLTADPIHLSLIETLAEPFVIGVPHEAISEPYVAEDQLGHQAQLLIDVGTLVIDPIMTTDFD